MSVEDAQELAMLSLYTSEERPQAVISIADERSISRVQRKKAYAIIGEIAKWSGYTPEETKWWMKFYYEAETGDQHFSFADTDMTTARKFISYLLDYAVKNHIPMSKSGLAYMDDVEAYMYSSLSHRSCV
ncbi:putative HNHc nuclease, partial [Weissella confusa]